MYFFLLIHIYLSQPFKAESDLNTTFPFAKLALSYFRTALHHAYVGL